MFKKYNIIVFIAILLLFVSCKQEEKFQTQTQIALGTICSIKLEDSVDDSVFSNCFSILQNVEKEISRTNEESYISILNRDKTVQVNQEVFDLFKLAISLAQLSDGKFDVAMGSVVSLWDIGGDNPRIPSKAELDSVNVDYTQIKLDEDTLTVEIPQNMQIDFGALGKGYAADKLVEYLKSENINKGIINLGGNVDVIGQKSDGSLWTIGLQDPNNQEEIFAALDVSDVSIVTSGTYERYFYQDGVKYHHILDPDTFYPSDSDIISSTIIGKQSLICDCLSTTSFLLGSERALELLKHFDGYSGFFLLKNNELVHSDNFDYKYQMITN
ncbi:MAG: FAD:protein FMN transferase [Pleomorphochaeta sp.]